MGDWGKMFDGRIEVSPPVDQSQLQAVPARRGVVLLAADGDKPVILLSATNIRARTAARLRDPQEDHRTKLPDLQTVTQTISWKLAHSHFEMNLQYLEIARAIWPEQYTAMVAWKPAWFVHVEPKGEFPVFVRTRDVFAQEGRYFGPFGDGRSAGRFIDALVDAFDLCRDPQCLRKSPNAQRCAYAQMGRCLAPCDGTIAMSEYRQIVAEAAEFAAGNREELRARLESSMKAAAGELQFERATGFRSRIERLAEFDRPACRFVAPAGKFRFIFLQSGPTRRKISVFLVDGGTVCSSAVLAYPLKDEQLAAAIASMRRLLANPQPIDQPGRWRMGLVAQCMFASGTRAGLAVRWRDDITTARLAGLIQSDPSRLRLTQPKPKASQSKSPPKDRL